MESETNHNCNFCETPNALKKCGKSHTRCKQIRFCNKNCDTAAHSKERESKVTANENPSDNSGNSFEKAIKAEIKRDAKTQRKEHQNMLVALNAPDRIARLNQDEIKILHSMRSSANTPRARNGQRQGIRVPQTPEDGTQDQH